ncbi:MAG: flagellar type III secretion system pore protein FliP [Chthoniobacterales bacterium]|nr:flagellar type III secretion system pore protein FliP [Chthoniobacterales bacterium]
MMMIIIQRRIKSARLARFSFYILFIVYFFSTSQVISQVNQVNTPAPPSVQGPASPTAPTVPVVNAPTAGGAPLLSLQIGGADGRRNFSTAIQIVFIMTLLTLAPSLIMLMTSFTRIVIVLSFIRTALGVPTVPANQILIAMSLILTFFIMSPVFDQIYNQALLPYSREEISSEEALRIAQMPIRKFMLDHTRPQEIEFFLQVSQSGPVRPEQIPFSVLLPAFVVSELRTAFQMGFLIFIPFMVIDFLVGSVLMSMGMMMMPPTMVSMPLKLLLFVLVDGWQLVIRSLLQSFGL